MFYTGVGKQADFEIEQILNLMRSEIEPLRLASLGEGFSFLDRLVQEWERGENRFQAPGESLWGAYSGEELLGICGLNKDPYAGRADVGRLRHLYVLPVRRREGIGRALALTVVGKAREHFASLQLRTDQDKAAVFYEKIGIAKAQDLPNATHQIRFDRGAGHGSE